MWMKHLGWSLWWIAFSSAVQAFPCEVFVVKDSCWKNYAVTVEVHDQGPQGMLAKIVIPKDKTYQRASFACTPGQTLKFSATYSPVFWASEKGKVYLGKRYVALPPYLKPHQKRWTLTLCFDDDFISVPLPPDTSGQCHCDLSVLPPEVSEGAAR